MGNIWRAQFDGNPYIGLFARASEDTVLVPRSASQKMLNGIASLGCKNVVKASVDGSPYLGIYTAMNSNGIIVPKMLTPEETLEVKGLGLAVHVMKNGKFSACGNNVACNDHGALVNPDIPYDQAKAIANCLGVELAQFPLAGYKCTGMACIASNKGWLAHNRINEEEMAKLESLFNCKGINGTVNSGTALVGAGVAATTKGAAIGEASSGFEIGRAVQAFDLA